MIVSRFSVDTQLSVPSQGRTSWIISMSCGLKQCRSNLSGCAAERDPTIFVSAIAFREPECHPTLKDMFAKVCAVPLQRALSNLLIEPAVGHAPVAGHECDGKLLYE